MLNNKGKLAAALHHAKEFSKTLADLGCHAEAEKIIPLTRSAINDAAVKYNIDIDEALVEASSLITITEPVPCN
jgi:hypothetical protein